MLRIHLDMSHAFARAERPNTPPQNARVFVSLRSHKKQSIDAISGSHVARQYAYLHAELTNPGGILDIGNS